MMFSYCTKHETVVDGKSPMCELGHYDPSKKKYKENVAQDEKE